MPGILEDILAELRAISVKLGTVAALPPAAGPDLVEEMVDLDQIAAMVHLKKCSMYGYRNRIPPPVVRGRRGRRSLWRWSEVGPWLQQEFGMILPVRFPGGKTS